VHSIGFGTEKIQSPFFAVGNNTGTVKHIWTVLPSLTPVKELDPANLSYVNGGNSPS
jgi:hypothetical protein